MRRPVRLTIDHLVLDGVAPEDRAALMRALETSLASELQAMSFGDSRQVDQLSVTSKAMTDRPADLGRGAGRAIAAKLRGPAS